MSSFDSSGSGGRPGNSQPLRISYVVPSWPPERSMNGITNYVANLVAAIGDRAQTSILSFDSPEGQPSLSDRVFHERMIERVTSRLEYRLGRSEPRNLALAFRVARHLGRNTTHPSQPLDLIEVEETFGFPEFFETVLKVPTVVRLHGPWFLNGEALGEDPRSTAFRRRVKEEGRALRRVRFVTAPSHDTLEQTRAYYGLALENAAVLPNPAPLVEPEEAWTLGASTPDTILFVGRFDAHKGGDVVLDAFARLPDSPRLFFVGPDRGLQRGSDLFSLPDYLARFPAGVRERVHVLGPKTPAEIAELRRQCRVTVVPSRYETFCMTAAEALAFGSPLVGARTGGIGEMIEDEVNGLSFDVEDADGLAAGITRILDSSELAETLSRGARNYYASTLHPDKVALETLQYYERVLAEA